MPLGDAIPEQLKNTISKSLTKTAFERPKAEEVLEDLRRVKRQLESSTEIVNQYTTENLHDLKTVQMPYKSRENALAETGEINRATSAKGIVKLPRRFLITVAIVVLLGIFGFGAYQYRAKINAPAVLSESDKLLDCRF